MTRTQLTNNGLAKVRFTDVIEYEINHDVVLGAVIRLPHPRYFTSYTDAVDTVSAKLAASLIASGVAVAA